jgi:phosphate transport system substrate-binding protein
MRPRATLMFRVSGLMVLAAAVAACGGGAGGPTSGQATSDVIRVDGSSTVFPITEAVAEEFQREHREARVTVGIAGTGGGFQKFCRDEIDIADASRPITAAEIEACAKTGVGYIELPIAYDGLAIVVHPKNTWAHSITVAELRKLWEPSAEGKIMRWSDVREGWPNSEIHLFGAGVDSGTFDYFTEAIVGKTDQSRGDYTSSEDDNVIVQGVSGDEYALGYFGYAYYEENKDKLKLVAVDDGNEANGAGPIQPSPQTVADGSYHPLSRPIFIYPRLKSLDRPEVNTFIEFYLTEGASLVREVGYIPLPDNEYELVRARFSSRRVGSMFHGDAQGGATLLSRLAQ